jgi:hypothetical protein
MKPIFVSLLLVLSGLFASFAEAATLSPEGNGAFLYVVGQSAEFRGSISIYDIGADHRLRQADLPSVWFSLTRAGPTVSLRPSIIRSLRRNET